MPDLPPTSPELRAAEESSAKVEDRTPTTRECPFCRERIHADAIRCGKCTSALVPLPTATAQPKDAADDRNVHLVLDRGFFYFAKFVAGAVAILLAAGATFFGFDLKHARDDVEKMQKEVEATEAEIRKTAASAQAAASSAQSIGAGAELLLKQGQARLDEVELQLRTKGEQKTHEFEQKMAEALNRIGKTGSKYVPAAPVDKLNAAPPRKTLDTGFSPLDVARGYGFPDGDGAQQVIGIVEFAGTYSKSDLTSYLSKLGVQLPEVTVVDGKDRTPNSEIDAQVMLDTEITGALAPKAKIRIYFAEFGAAGMKSLLSKAKDDGVSVLLCGWGQPESMWGPGEVSEVNAALKAAAEAGITIVVADGDGDGMGKSEADFPASSPYVLAVGGTRLMLDPFNEAPWAAAAGSRESQAFARPDWQIGQGVDPQQAHRLIPDVSANADPSTGYRIRVGGQQMVIGGTAAAAALWAGFIARLNQALGRNVGYLTPALYGPNGAGTNLRDIASGSGRSGASAGKGWDRLTGWGSPDGQGLVARLRGGP